MDDDGFRREFVTVDDVTIHAVVLGDGPPLLLLHGFPQSHVMWREVAPVLAGDFTVVCPDLRGYGDSSKPPGDPDHMTYSKRQTAADQVAVMEAMGFDRFAVAGHDRGGRVAHRLALDHRDQVARLAVLDIVPTLEVFETITAPLATEYYHWFFLIQPNGLPEHLIGLDPEWFLRRTLGSWGSDVEIFDDEVLAEYARSFCDPAAIHAMCEDYRAGASIDLDHDRADLDQPLECPLLALWGENAVANTHHDVLAAWHKRAVDVRGFGLDAGHFLAEECPDETAEALVAFFAQGVDPKTGMWR